jgi:hypothetical protein
MPFDWVWRVFDIPTLFIEYVIHITTHEMCMLWWDDDHRKRDRKDNDSKM